jgi:putative membrane protein
MTRLNRWGIAAGIAAALTFAGNARAQSPGTSNQTAEPAPRTADPSGTGRAGERSGWSGTDAKESGSAASQSRDAQQGKSEGMGTGSNAQPQGKLDKKLDEAMQKLHAGNQAEVQMGQLGAQQAQSPEVKDYAQKLVDDHEKNDQKLTQMAQPIGANLNGDAFAKMQKDTQKELSKLQGKTGQDFDKAFMKQAVKDHEKDTKLMKDAAKQARKDNQQELASFFEATYTGMQGHLDHAKQIEKSLSGSHRQARQPARSGASDSGTGSSGGMSGSQQKSATPGDVQNPSGTPSTPNQPGSSGGSR